MAGAPGAVPEGSGAGRGSEGGLGPPPSVAVASLPSCQPPRHRAVQLGRSGPSLRLDPLSAPQRQLPAGPTALRSLRLALGSLCLGRDMGTMQPSQSACC